jgi:hypothetical protein
MTYQSGSAIAYYILDISDAERKASQLRSIYQGIRQDASSLATPVVASTNAVGNTNAYATAIATLGTKSAVTASETQLLINRTRELGTAQGLTTDEINAQLAALSREALAVGNVNAALELEDAALGKSAEATAINEKEVAKLARTIQAQADAELRLAQQNARTLQATGNNTGALQLLTQARGNATNASAQAVASAETQIASLNKTTTATGALSGQLSTFLNPLALFTVGMGVAIGVVHSFGEALDFKANLDELNNSNALLLRGTRNVTQAFDEAQNFANKYKLTQKETNEAISESIPVIRGSQSSMEDILSVFTRLTILKPGKTFNDASRALGELQAGNAVSLERIFNILPDDANRMKKEIQGGADAVQVLSKYLSDVGIGTEALELRAKGLKGSMRDAAIAAEDLKRAQADFAAGPGLVLLESQINLTRGATRLLTLDFSDMGTSIRATLASSSAYNTVIAQGGTVTEAQAAATKAYNKVLQDLAASTQNVTTKTYNQVAAFDEDRIAIGKLQIAAGGLKDIGDKASAFSAVLTRTQNERATGRFESLSEQVNQEKQQIQNAKDLQAAQLNYAQATNNVVEQRKILNDELKAAAGNQTQELNIKAQIAALDKQKEVKPTKGLSGLDRSEIKLAGDLQAQLDEVNRRLANSNLTQQQRNQLLIQQGQLQEKINDAMQKERDLQTNIALDAVHDQQKRIAEARELDGLRRAENSTRFSAAQQVAIRLREQEILLEQQKRSNDITKENYDLNKSVKESGVGAAQTGVGTSQGGTPVSQVPPIGSALPVGAQGVIPQVQIADGKQPINITINIDKDGKATVTPFDAGVTLKLIGNAFGVQASSGGFP